MQIIDGVNLQVWITIILIFILGVISIFIPKIYNRVYKWFLVTIKVILAGVDIK